MSLIAHYRLDGSARDSEGSLHGSAVAVTWAPSQLNTELVQAGGEARLDGSASRIDTGVQFTTETTASLPLWFRPGEGAGHLVGQHDGTNGLAIEQTETGKIRLVVNGTASAEVPVYPGEYYRVVLSYDAGEATLRMDTELAATVTETVTWPAVPVTIGARADGNAALECDAVDLRIETAYTPPPAAPVLPDNDISGVFPGQSGWQWHPDRGYHNDSPTWGTKRDINLPIPENAGKVSAVFTGYYNQPGSCLGQNMIYIELSNGQQAILGTNDAWGDNTNGHTIEKGDDGTIFKEPIQVVEETFTYTCPPGVYVVAVQAESNRLSGWTASDRGFKRLTIGQARPKWPFHTTRSAATMQVADPRGWNPHPTPLPNPTAIPKTGRSDVQGTTDTFDALGWFDQRDGSGRSHQTLDGVVSDPARQGFIEGNTTDENSQPVSRRVRCFERTTGRLVRETWSNQAGFFRFTDLDPALRFTILAHDYSGEFNAVVADNAQPEIT